MKAMTEVETAITEATGAAAEIASSTQQFGGSICEAHIAKLVDGRSFFIKTHAQSKRFRGMFEAEYQALELLIHADAIRVPEPVAANAEFIVMEAFTAGSKAQNWQEQMGRQLALLHQTTRREQFGLDFDNFIGATPQPNAAMDTWIRFWRERRLKWQIERFAAAGNQGDPLIPLCWELSESLDEILDGPPESAVLLHGDLWSGNAAADEHGAPIIYDPASYYGHREAEFGIMQMFGGFDQTSHAAYAEVWPLADGHERRIPVYRLYHELNHLNLFGRSYYDSCVKTIRSAL
jgi:fructosamine-3-kinase